MIGRILWLAALAAIAVLTTGLQLDRSARSDPAIAPLIPGPLRNYAQVAIAQFAVNAGDAETALAETQTLVRRRPVPAEYLTLLAAGQAKAGQEEAALRTIQIAGQRGWRDPAAQEVVLRLALAAGDTAEAARRYSALFLREGTPDRLLQELGPPVLDEPDGPGQRTLVAIVVGGERWQTQFLRRGVRVMPPAAFAAITAQSMKKGAAFDCGRLAQTIRTLARRDAAAGEALAAAAGEGRCPQLAPGR